MDHFDQALQLLASGQLDQGRELLHRCLQLAPGHSHACVALALGCQRAGDLPRAKEYTMQALAADPRNPVALKNLGAILGKEKGSLRALYYLRRSNECDPQDLQTVFGLAFAYKGAERHGERLERLPEDAGGGLHEEFPSPGK